MRAANESYALNMNIIVRLFYRKEGIDSVKGYKYLEIWLVCNGKFNKKMNELAKQRYESNS